MSLLREQIFLSLQRCIGSYTDRYLKEFMTLEHCNIKDLQQLTENRLNKILEHVRNNVPFYRKSVGTSSHLSIKNFPILSKETIREHFLDLMIPSLKEDFQHKNQKKRLYSWIEVKTGGSSGVPTTVIHDATFRDSGRASRLYSQALCGFPYGTPYYRLWGSMQEINQMQDSFLQRFIRWLGQEELLNAFQMSDSSIECYLKQINQGRVDYLMAYVDAAYHMALYAKKNSIQVRPIKNIMACAGTVTEDIRNTLQEVFGARVHNKYGSRDCADMACECDHGGIHIYSNNVYIEIVDDHGNSCPPSKTGRILITTLHNYSFPLIRYEIGDMGALGDGLCECGRPFPLLKKIEGRSVEFLLTNDGGYVSPVYIRHLIGVVHNPGFIRRFQLIQNSRTHFELLLEVENNTSEDSFKKHINFILRDLKTVLGVNSEIAIKQVAEISPTGSGKFLYTVNKLKTII
jgi:phenylacetate-CoA ligase